MVVCLFQYLLHHIYLLLIRYPNAFSEILFYEQIESWGVWSSWSWSWAGRDGTGGQEREKVEGAKKVKRIKKCVRIKTVSASLLLFFFFFIGIIADRWFDVEKGFWVTHGIINIVLWMNKWVVVVLLWLLLLHLSEKIKSRLCEGAWRGRRCKNDDKKWFSLLCIFNCPAFQQF